MFKGQKEIKKRKTNPGQCENVVVREAFFYNTNLLSSYHIRNLPLYNPTYISL